VESDPAAVVRAHLEAENAHDVARILATLADHGLPSDGSSSLALTLFGWAPVSARPAEARVG